jgi:hypothetical protein
VSRAFFDGRTKEDFNRARLRAVFGRALALLRNEKDQLLSLKEVKALLRPHSESYRGLKTVPIGNIVGSEGRYLDFNRVFLPKHEHLRGRWTRVDLAHYQQIHLPPVTLYEIGGVYFVRDGNHRVSVARTQGAEFIDAEVISLKSRLPLQPGMGREELKKAVIELEKQEFFRYTGLDGLRPGLEMEFTDTGRYDEVLLHIHGHKYFINQSQLNEIPFQEAMLSWYDGVYEPLVRLIRSENILIHFPGREMADLYMWIVGHWDVLKRQYGQAYPLRQAVEDFRRRFGRPVWNPLVRVWLRLRRRVAGDQPSSR